LQKSVRIHHKIVNIHQKIAIHCPLFYLKFDSVINSILSNKNNLKFKAMKTIIFFFSCMMLTIIALGQDQKPNLGEVKVTAPKFSGIENAAKMLNGRESETINVYLSENFYYPVYKDVNPEGTEVIQFTVTPSGELTNFVIINSVSHEIDEEMIRVLQTTNGMWIPGLNNNVPAEMTKEVSLVFYPGNNSSKSVTKIFTEKATPYFINGSKILFEKQNPKKAMKNFTRGINYLPHDKSLLIMRGICRFETGDKKGAHQDWERVKTLGGFDIENDYLTENAKGLKSYDEMTSVFKK